jgi:hypothetical protein
VTFGPRNNRVNSRFRLTTYRDKPRGPSADYWDATLRQPAVGRHSRAGDRCAAGFGGGDMSQTAPDYSVRPKTHLRMTRTKNPPLF